MYMLFHGDAFELAFRDKPGKSGEQQGSLLPAFLQQQCWVSPPSPQKSLLFSPGNLSSLALESLFTISKLVLKSQVVETEKGNALRNE